jgi:hypothetical protein
MSNRQDTPSSAPGQGNNKGRAPAPQSEVQKLQKKLEAVQKDRNTLSTAYISNMPVVAEEKNFGKDAKVIVLKMGMSGGMAAQTVISRPIGYTPSLEATDWCVYDANQIPSFKENENNPFDKKTGEAVSKLKTASAIKAKLLIENSDGQICYPDNKVRQVELNRAKEIYDFHKKVEGNKAFQPNLLYMEAASRDAELKYLSHMATDLPTMTAVDGACAQYRSYETMGGIGNVKQVAVPYLKGIPEKLVHQAMIHRMMGTNPPESWDLLKEEPPIKTDRFTPVH